MIVFYLDLLDTFKGLTFEECVDLIISAKLKFLIVNSKNK